MKKILILINSVDGLYSFRFELIEELKNQGYNVYFCVPQNEKNEKVVSIKNIGAKYIQTPIDRRGVNPFKDLSLVKQYDEIIQNIQPDIILTYTIKPNIYGNYIANKYNVPVIMNITGIGTSLVSSKLKQLIKYLYKYAGSKSKVVFFQNISNQEFFISNKLVDREKTKLIPGSGVNINKFHPMEKEIEENMIKFLFIGRLMKEKGIEEYLAAANEINKKYNNIEFQIVGSFEEEKYQNLFNENVKYLGISSDVREQIKKADCIVNPSYHEGMSNVLLEGAAMGKPLLASNIPGCKEIIDYGKNGFLFESQSASALKEAIIKFIKLSEKEREEMGSNSRKKVEKEFERQIVVDTYIKEIKKILEE